MSWRRYDWIKRMNISISTRCSARMCYPELTKMNSFLCSCLKCVHIFTRASRRSRNGFQEKWFRLNNRIAFAHKAWNIDWIKSECCWLWNWNWYSSTWHTHTQIALFIAFACCNRSAIWLECRFSYLFFFSLSAERWIDFRKKSDQWR